MLVKAIGIEEFSCRCGVYRTPQSAPVGFRTAACLGRSYWIFGIQLRVLNKHDSRSRQKVVEVIGFASCSINCCYLLGCSIVLIQMMWCISQGHAGDIRAVQTCCASVQDGKASLAVCIEILMGLLSVLVLVLADLFSVERACLYCCATTATL